MGATPEYASGEVIANKYVVEGPLGDGPCGRSYLANSGLGSQKLCVKIFRPDLSARLLSAPDFFLKAGVATEIEHDNLVSCLDVQEEMGLAFSARTYVEGHDFEEWLRRNRREGNYFTRGLELLWQACQGLAALHERTRHLNIHPGNLFITPLQAKLADWDPRSLGSMEMTPEPLPFHPRYAGYRAPEMAGRGSFLSYPSTDLFAVAGLLYRMVLGEHPGLDPARTQAGIRGLEGDLGAFLAKAMHPRPEERYQDASAFSDALWGLQPAMQRLQDSQGSAPRGEAAGTPLSAAEKTPPTLAMAPGGESTLFGAPATAAQKPINNDSFFDLFPGNPGQSSRPVEARREEPKAPKALPTHETLFGASSLEAPAGGTLFGTGPAQAEPRKIPARDPRPGARAGAAKPPPDPKPAAVTLSSLEKDAFDAGQDGAPMGHTQFGFKGTGDSRTLYAEGDGHAGRRKLMIALAAVGILVLALALGGLFVFLRSTAAPEIPSTTAPGSGDDLAGTPDADAYPAPAAGQGTVAPGTTDAGTASSGAGAAAAGTTAPDADRPPFPASETEDGESPDDPAARPDAARPAAAGAAKGSPERMAELLRMVEARQWPPSARERLQAADELNDFGKVAEANILYGRAVTASGATEKQKISALGGLAVTFYSMGMKQQAADAVAQILDINPRNGFALKFREKLK